MKKQYSLLTLTLTAAGTAAATLLAVFVMGFFRFGGSEGVNYLGKLDLLRRIAQTQYVGETDMEAVTDSACRAFVESLGDRWSYYMTAEEYADYQQRGANMVSGIGVTVTAREEGGFEIISVTPDSPAEAAGVKAGQVIVSLEGQDVRDLDTTALRALILSQSGSFELGLLDACGTEVSVTVSTQTFYSNPVSFELLEDGIGYIRIANFEEGSAENTASAIAALREQGARALAFDVRSNPGGRLSELIDMLDPLLPEGDVFISVGKGGEEEIYTSDADCLDMPMAVLINGNTYSAAEFFAAALGEYGRAVIVGEPSTGKGRSQVTYELSDGSAVHISTRRYLTPNRVDLSEQGGLTPDIIEEMGGQGDAQLDAAVEELRKSLS
ncbi:MAG: S41 family peptidase [Butyricicoccus sp.]|nr:S41 family peptidase [Butyricicoccus sp.]